MVKNSQYSFFEEIDQLHGVYYIAFIHWRLLACPIIPLYCLV